MSARDLIVLLGASFASFIFGVALGMKLNQILWRRLCKKIEAAKKQIQDAYK